MLHFNLGFTLSSLGKFGPAPVFTRQVVRCSYVLVRPGPIRTIYAGFVINANSSSEISNRTTLSPVVDSSFSTFEYTMIAL